MLKWPDTPRRPAARRRAPTSCWPAPSRCCSSSAAARACRCSSTADDPRIEPSLAALADAVQRGRIKRLALEKRRRRADRGLAYEEPLIELGFRAGPRKLTLDDLTRVSELPRGAGLSDSTQAMRPEQHGRVEVARAVGRARWMVAFRRSYSARGDVRARVDDDPGDALARAAAHHARLGAR